MIDWYSAWPKPQSVIAGESAELKQFETMSLALSLSLPQYDAPSLNSWNLLF